MLITVKPIAHAEVFKTQTVICFCKYTVSQNNAMQPQSIFNETFVVSGLGSSVFRVAGHQHRPRVGKCPKQHACW